MKNPIYAKKLKEISKSKKSQYKNAFPFPYLVIDNFFNEDYLNFVHEEFPSLIQSKEAIHHSGETDEKHASPRGTSLQKEYTKNLLMFMNGSEFLDFLQELTGIEEKLIPDPHFIGGGMHETYKGGFLKIHADFCKHPETNLDRRINVLVYLNKAWDDKYNGDLYLYESKMKKHVKISPIFNRVVIFNTTDFTYHGVPDPLNCPEKISRKSLALYYFTNGRPRNEVRSIFEKKSTLYKERSGEKFNYSIKHFLTLLMPPIIYSFIKNLRNLKN